MRWQMRGRRRGEVKADTSREHSTRGQRGQTQQSKTNVLESRAPPCGRGRRAGPEGIVWAQAFEEAKGFRTKEGLTWLEFCQVA